MIDLYTWATPNGRKVSIALEEMAMPYSVHKVDIGNGEQFTPEFHKLNPNNKIPAIFDHENGLSVFESGAILIYLAEKSGQFLTVENPARAKTLEWLSWQTAGFGPMLGQLNFFVNRADVEMLEAIQRFTDETIRLYAVLDQQLAKYEYVAGEYSIADMAIYPWSAAAYDAVISRAKSATRFVNVERWHKIVSARPGVQAGMSPP